MVNMFGVGGLFLILVGGGGIFFGIFLFEFILFNIWVVVK